MSEHDAQDREARLQALHPLFAAHEAGLAAVILSALAQTDNVRVLGKPHCDDGGRGATIAELLRPPSQLAFEELTAEPAPLPEGKITVLHRQGR